MKELSKKTYVKTCDVHGVNWTHYRIKWGILDRLRYYKIKIVAIQNKETRETEYMSYHEFANKYIVLPSD